MSEFLLDKLRVATYDRIIILNQLDIFWGNQLDIFWGNPPFGPLKNLKISEFLKFTPRWPHITQYFYCWISWYYQNKDVCKKLELKILKFDRMAHKFDEKKNFGDFFQKFDFSAIFEKKIDFFFDFS